MLKRELAEHRARQAGRHLRWVQPDALVFQLRGKPQSGLVALAMYGLTTRGEKAIAKLAGGGFGRIAPVAVYTHGCGRRGLVAIRTRAPLPRRPERVRHQTPTENTASPCRS